MVTISLCLPKGKCLPPPLPTPYGHFWIFLDVSCCEMSVASFSLVSF